MDADVSPETSQERHANVDPPGDPVAQMQVFDLLAKKQPCLLQLYGDRLRIRMGEDEPLLVIMKNDLAERTTVLDTLLVRRSLTVKTPKKRLFQFSSNDFATFQEWKGPPTRRDLQAALKARFGHVALISIMFLLSSMPFPGDAEAGVEPLSFNPLWFTLGLSLMGIALLAKRVPHRVFFLLDSLWVAVLAASLTHQIVTGGSLFWLIVIALQVQLIVRGIKQFRRYSFLSEKSGSTS